MTAPCEEYLIRSPEEEAMLDEIIRIINAAAPPCTVAQRQFVYQLCTQVEELVALNPRKLPAWVSPKEETRDLTIAEISDVIELLLMLRELAEEEEYRCYEEEEFD